MFKLAKTNQIERLYVTFLLHGIICSLKLDSISILIVGNTSETIISVFRGNITLSENRIPFGTLILH
jgi:hypothetical protein